MSNKSNDGKISRRDAVLGAGAIGLAAMSQSGNAQAGNAAALPSLQVMKDGKYPTQSLRQEKVNVSACQTPTMSVDVRNLKATLKINLDNVLRMIDVAQGMPAEWGPERRWGAKQDLLCFHELPLQGWQPWNRKELNMVAIDLPGPESEAIGERAKRYGCYIAFGCYSREKDWPGHVINMSVIVGPKGDIVAKQWKQKNEIGMEAAFGAPVGLLSTTVYDVLDRYVEMYGWEAVLPVARTDIGNITMTSAGRSILLYPMFAMRGCEILILSVTGGSNRVRVESAARDLNMYAVGVMNSVSFGNLGFPESTGGVDGGTVICGPHGQLRATSTHHVDIAASTIPMAEFRQNRRVPEIPIEMYLPVLQQYQPKFKKNAFLEYLPEDHFDSGDFVYKRMGWK
ncbi:MAG: hypothetical protein IPG25_18985 [Proteobacteria bacterium]|nr:hypothetical protein [Pseudomonadota bacterium]